MNTKMYVGMIASLAFFTALSTFAGTKHGGGGKGVQCGERLVTLDLWEAENLEHLPRREEFSNIEDANQYYCFKFVEHFKFSKKDDQEAELVCKNALHKFNEKVNWVVETIPSSDDATLPELPEGCQIVQIAFWDDGLDRILINRNLWEKLSPTDQVALIYHEDLFSTLRRSNRDVETSDEARRVVGHIMLDDHYRPKYEEAIDAPAMFCGLGGSPEAPKTHSFMVSEVTQNGIPGLLFSFEMVQGYYKMERVTYFAARKSLAFISLGSFPVVDPRGRLLADYAYFKWDGSRAKIRVSGEGEPEAQGMCWSKGGGLNQ